MKLLISVIGVISVAALALGFMSMEPVSGPFGAANAPAVLDGCTEVDGVRTCYKKALFNSGAATTTACSFKSPAATSTLTFGSAQITSATSTAIQLEMGKSTSFAATTTSLGLANVASGAKDAFIASSSPTAAEATIFAPNTYFNVIWGGAALGSSLGGVCNAVFVVS